MKVYLVEMETLEPVVVVAKKGKSRFVEGLNYIPASSIAGALGRKAILENLQSSVGNCKNLSLDKTPDCSNCPSNCFYRALWMDKKAKVTNAVKGNWEFRSPGIANLQSVCESRIKYSGENSKKDYLFELFLERMAWMGKASPRKIEKILERGHKKSPSTFDGTEFRDIRMMQFTRVGINERLKTAEEGLLYSFTAIGDGQKLRFMVFCDEKFEGILNGEMKVGAWKSRGMGLVKSRIVAEMKEEEYLRSREREILKGFDEISNLLSGSELEGYYGTFTFLTDGTKKPDLEIIFEAIKVNRLIRYEKSGEGGFFIARNTIATGSAGVFYAKEPEEFAKSLAELELRIFSSPWFDWVFFNHPVHYEKSVLRG